MNRSRQFVLWVALATPFTFVSAQVQVIPGMPITASGSVSAAYVHSNTNSGLDNLNMGSAWDVAGSYYNPKFLQFQVSPYYDFGREFSQTEFVTGGKGVGASLNAFSGGSFPLTINYHRAKTSEATYNLPGSPNGIGGNGTSQDMSVGWAISLWHLPTLQLSYLKNDGDFITLGSDAHGSSHGDGYSIGSQYVLLGFNLMATYGSTAMAQTLPNLFMNSAVSTDTKQKTLRFGVSRTLWTSTYFDSTASRLHWTSDATGKLEDRTFDSAAASLSTRFSSKFSTGLHLNYSSDLSGSRISSLLAGTPSTETGGLFPVALATGNQFKTLGYSEAVNYSVGHGLRLGASAQQGTGSDTSGATTNTSMDSAHANYGRKLFGGSISAGYGLGLSNISYTSGNTGALSTSSGISTSSGSSLGHSASLGYSHQAGMGWGYNGSFQYSQSDSQGTLALSSRSYGGDFSVKSRVFRWNVTAGAHLNKSRAESTILNEDLQKSFRIAVSKGPLNLTASQQFSSGLSLITAAGLQLLPVTDSIVIGNSLNNLITPTTSKSSSLAMTYAPSRLLELDASWTRAQYETILASGKKDGLNDQLDFIVKYRFRQMDCRAGYRRYLQQFSGVASQFNAQTVYFQVSRRFNLF